MLLEDTLTGTYVLMWKLIVQTFYDDFSNPMDLKCAISSSETPSTNTNITSMDTNLKK